MKKDIRREQISLLRFEKKIAGLAAALAAGSATVHAAEQKLGGSAASDAYAELQNSILQLAEAATNAHELLNAEAVALGLKTLQVNGVPKSPPTEIVRLALGIG